MKHDWYDPRSEEPVDPEPKNIGELAARDMSIYGMRRCRTCGARQTKNSNHLWMRVVGYSWGPRVGRCPGQMMKNPPPAHWQRGGLEYQIHGVAEAGSASALPRRARPGARRTPAERK